jgi:hypothetical protein
MSNTYTVWGVNGATRLAMNQHHMAGVLRMRGGLGEARAWPPTEAAGVWSGSGDNLRFDPYETSTVAVPVLDVQEALYLHGWKGADRQPLTLDGKWGPNTKAAFDKFADFEAQEERARVPHIRDYPGGPAEAEYAAKLQAVDAKWTEIKRVANAAVNATAVRVPFGEARARLFSIARPETLPGTRPSGGGGGGARPGGGGGGGGTPDTRTPPPEKKEETDWTTWVLTGAGVVVAGVAIWAIFRKKRK